MKELLSKIKEALISALPAWSKPKNPWRKTKKPAYLQGKYADVFIRYPSCARRSAHRHHLP